MMQPTIRAACLADLPLVEAVHQAAFPTDLEARLVRLLVSRGRDECSLAAVVEKQIVGHILFSPATCAGAGGQSTGLGLAPLAVLPDFQRQGIGTALIRAGLTACQALHTPWIVVLGEPGAEHRETFRSAGRAAARATAATTRATAVRPPRAARRPFAFRWW